MPSTRGIWRSPRAASSRRACTGTKSEGGNAGMHQNVIEHSTLMKPGKAYETVEGGYMG